MAKSVRNGAIITASDIRLAKKPLRIIISVALVLPALVGICTTADFPRKTDFFPSKC